MYLKRIKDSVNTDAKLSYVIVCASSSSLEDIFVKPAHRRVFSASTLNSFITYRADLYKFDYEVDHSFYGDEPGCTCIVFADTTKNEYVGSITVQVCVDNAYDLVKEALNL